MGAVNLSKLQILRIALCIVLFIMTTVQIYILFFGRRRKLAGLRRALVYGALFVAVVLLPSIVPDAVVPDFLTTEAGEGKPAQMPDWLVYYNQTEEPWANAAYGEGDLIQDTGCGPTVVAMAVSSLTETQATPKDVADWAYENGYWSPGSGSYHTLIQDGLAHYGLESSILTSKEEVKAALEEHYPVIALMGEGHFTGGGHFLLLCDLPDGRNVVLADPKSRETTVKLWSLNTIVNESKVSPTTGGAFWKIEKQAA